MNEEDLRCAKEYYQIMEGSILNLPEEQRASVYRPCAVNCVKDTVLKEQKREFEECHGDLGLQYEKYGNSDYFFGKVIEKGRVYEVGFPRCLCHLVDTGFAKEPIHCECSRQSILYILQELMPEKKIQVTTLETVLSGSEKCRFRVVVE